MPFCCHILAVTLHTLTIQVTSFTITQLFGFFPSHFARKGFSMKEYTTEFLRNIALVSHGGAGKTMLAETFLHATGATTRLGKVEDGTAVSDYDDEEQRRTISIYASVIPIEHRDHKINVID